jgi:hypothetical protein
MDLHEKEFRISGHKLTLHRESQGRRGHQRKKGRELREEGRHTNEVLELLLQPEANSLDIFKSMGLHHTSQLVTSVVKWNDGSYLNSLPPHSFRVSIFLRSSPEGTPANKDLTEVLHRGRLTDQTINLLLHRGVVFRKTEVSPI